MEDIKFIERGYEDFDIKLRGLGAKIARVQTERDLTKFRFQIAN